MTPTPLHEIAIVTMGTAPPGDTYNTEARGIPMIAGAGDYGDLHPAPKKYTTSPLAIAEPGDLLVCVRATIGDLNWADRRYCLGRGVAGIRPRDGLVDLRYLSHVVAFSKGWLNSKGTGSTFPAIRKADLQEMPVPLPYPDNPKRSLAEQKRIAAILDQADAIRRRRHEAARLTDQLIPSLFYEMFGDPTANPRGWTVRAFSELWATDARNGLSPASRGEIRGRVLTLSAITGNRFDAAAVKSGMFANPPAADQLVRTDKLLICRGNGNRNLVGKGWFPTCSFDDVVYPDTMIGTSINQALALRDFVEALWQTRHVRRQLEAVACTTSGIYKINQTMLASVKLPVPPLPRQREFSVRARSLHSMHKDAIDGTSTATALFNSLVQRAFRGDL